MTENLTVEVEWIAEDKGLRKGKMSAVGEKVEAPWHLLTRMTKGCILDIKLIQ